MTKKSGAKYSAEARLEIELALIHYHHEGLKIGDICEKLVEDGFKSPDGSELKSTSIRTMFYRLRDNGRFGEAESVETTEPETELESEPESELETECDQVVYDCLISRDLSNNQKVGMLRGYYGIN